MMPKERSKGSKSQVSVLELEQAPQLRTLRSCASTSSRAAWRSALLEIAAACRMHHADPCSRMDVIVINRPSTARHNCELSGNGCGIDPVHMSLHVSFCYHWHPYPAMVDSKESVGLLM